MESGSAGKAFCWPRVSQGGSGKPPMLAILATHPIQYQAPIWQELARRGRVPFEVWYLTAHGIRPSLDSEFKQVVQWDLDLLSGYPWRLPPDAPHELPGRSWELGLPADFRDRLRTGGVRAVFVPGWGVRACWEATFHARRACAKIWMRGDSNDLKKDSVVKRALKRPILGALLSRVDAFLCVGVANRRLYEGYGAAADRLVDGLHCVDNHRFAVQAGECRPDRAALRRAWNIPEGAFCLVYAGKLIPKKRPLDLVRAAEILGRIDPSQHYHLLFVGTGELEEEVRRACSIAWDFRGDRATDGAPGRRRPSASLAGFLNQREISRAYVAADALVLASDSGETWGLVVNEAMASGLPCVVSQSCGCAEDLVIPISPSLSYPCGDVKALASSILDLRRHHLANTAFVTQVDRYSTLSTVLSLEKLWMDRDAR